MRDPLHPDRSTIDHRRRSVSVPRHLMPVLLALHAGERSCAEADVRSLRADGLIRAQRLDPLLVTLISVMTNPALVVTVEVRVANTQRLATIWGTPHQAVLGMTDDTRRFDLIQIEPELLPFHLAQATGLVPRPLQPFSGGFAVPACALHSAEDLIARDLIAAEEALITASVSSTWADRLLTALSYRQSLWTAKSVWLGIGPRRSQAGLTVLDAGRAGCWVLSEMTPGGDLRIDVSNFDEIMHRFTDLLPDSSAIGF